MTRRLQRALTILLGFSALLTVAAQAEPTSGGVLHVAHPLEPFSLDSRIDPKLEGITVVAQVQEGLLSKDLSTGEFIPGLAGSWSVSGDSKTYTFNLRQGVTFHDGTDFTSEDVLFTFDYLTGEREGGIYVSQYAPMIASVEADGPYTVIIELVEPWEDFESLLVHHWATKILSKEAVLAAGDAYGQDSPPVGTGPFRFEEWVKGETLSLSRNEAYWQDGLPYLDGIVYHRVPDGPLRVVNLRSGNVDVAFQPPLDQLDQVASQGGLNVVCAPGNPMVVMHLNTAVEPFSDVRVRQALAYAIDREELVAGVYGDYARVAVDAFPAWHWHHDASYEGYEQDQELAVQLLAEAGYGPGNPLAFELNPLNEAEYRDLGVFLQAQLAEVGIKVTLTPMESATLNSYQYTDDFKADVTRWGLPSTIADDYMFKLYHSTGALNLTRYNQEGGYQHQEVDELISLARTSSSTEANAVYRQLVDLITDDMPLVRIAFKDNCQIAADHVRGLEVQGTDVFPMTSVWMDK